MDVVASQLSSPELLMLPHFMYQWNCYWEPGSGHTQPSQGC